MPPLPKYITDGMQQVEDALARSARKGARDAIASLEALVAELDPTQQYPLDWLLFRLGAADTQRPPATGSVAGAALAREIGTLAERLADRARLGERDAPAGSLAITELAREWSVSVKTINRYRDLGMVVWRVRDRRDRVVVRVSPDMARRFRDAHAHRVGRAGAFERTTPQDEARMIRRAARYRRRLGMSLNASAERIAPRFGRSHETVRQILIRHDARSPSPIFGERPQASSWRRRVAFRALRRGIEPGTIARKWGRGVPSVVRLAVEHRAFLLRSIQPHPGPRPPEDELRAALLEEPVRRDIGSPCQTTLVGQLEAARRHLVPIGVVEATRLRAYRLLVAEAAAAAAELRPSGAKVSDVDRIETDLRWASLLKIELVRSQLPLALKTFEAQVGLPVERLRADQAREALAECVATIAGVVDRFDQASRGRLAAPVSLAMNRVASRWKRERREGLAASIIGHAIPAPDWTRSVNPWQAWLWPDPRLRAFLTAIEPRPASVLRLRFGLGEFPRTAREAGAELGLTPMHLGRLEREAIRAALDAARREET